MLSIRFDDQREWWASGVVFDRLFRSALDGGALSPGLAVWREVANANGGLDLTLVEPDVAQQLTAGLCLMARRELAALGEPAPASPDASYQAGLRALAEVASGR